jgi:hypothetical protein
VLRLRSIMLAGLAAGTVLLAGSVPAGAAGALAAAPPRPAGARGWHVAKTIAVRDTFLYSVAAVPGGDAWAGGRSPSGPVIYRLAAGKWRHQASLAGRPGAFVNQLSATSRSNVWATIANDVAHLSGRGWKLISFARGTDDIMLDGAVTTGPKNTWAFVFDRTTGKAYSLHYTGSRWRSGPLPFAPGALTDTGLTSALSADNIWALSGGGKVLRYNGTRWAASKLPGHVAPSGQAVDFEQILALSRSSVWVTAFTASNTAGTLGPVILLHWNGRSWAKIRGTLPAGALTGAIASDGHGGLWLGGSTAHGSPRLFHYSCGKWTISKLPQDALGLPSLVTLALIPGTRSLVGVANLGSAFGTDKGAEIIRYDP